MYQTQTAQFLLRYAEYLIALHWLRCRGRENDLLPHAPASICAAALPDLMQEHSNLVAVDDASPRAMVAVDVSDCAQKGQ
jgi:hypothetical protein